MKKEATKSDETNESYLDAIEGNVAAAIRLAKAEYQKKPLDPMYSIITELELTLMEIKNINK